MLRKNSGSEKANRLLNNYIKKNIYMWTEFETKLH